MRRLNQALINGDIVFDVVNKIRYRPAIRVVLQGHDHVPLAFHPSSGECSQVTLPNHSLPSGSLN